MEGRMTLLPWKLQSRGTPVSCLRWSGTLQEHQLGRGETQLVLTLKLCLGETLLLQYGGVLSLNIQRHLKLKRDSCYSCTPTSHLYWYLFTVLLWQGFPLCFPVKAPASQTWNNTVTCSKHNRGHLDWAKGVQNHRQLKINLCKLL